MMEDKTMWKYYIKFIKENKEWMIAMALPDKINPEDIDNLSV